VSQKRASPPPKALQDLGRETVLYLNQIANRSAAPQADSAPADLAALTVDFNALLAKLREAGLLQE
jgi:hypothetical protein